MSHIHRHATRRHFLRQSAALSALGGTSFLTNLALMGEAAAQSSTGYKALVCVYLGGGNDHSNLVVPREGSAYSAYASGRGALALPAAQLLPIQPQGFGGPALGLHPSLSRLQGLMGQGRLAIMANVGTLVAPTSLSQWNSGRPTVAVPYQLFSHSDQNRQWQTGLPDAFSKTGWLGRAGDLMTSMNSGPVSLCMSMAGNNVIQVGRQVVQYQVTSQGPVQIYKLDTTYDFNSPALRQLMTDPNRTHLMERELTRVARRAIEAEAGIRGAIAGTAAWPAYGGGSLGAQLRMVARMIAARDSLGHQRQVFFVQHGGYDFHADLLVNQAARLAEVDAALSQFYQSTLDLGVSSQVTTFTASEFGRSLQSNGAGSDHGWGGHQFVMGGSVLGNRVYGQWPTVALKGPEDAGNGRLLPTTAVDQYAATLATWLGVKSGDLSTVIPNIGRFGSANLGFLG